MAVAEKQNENQIVVDGSQFDDVVGRLCEVADTHPRRSDYFSRCFEILSEFFGAATGILNVRMGARSIERSFEKHEGCLSQWHSDLDSLVLRAQSNETSLLQKYSDQSGRNAVYAIAAPILSPSFKSFGSIGLVIAASAEVNGRTALALLGQLLQLIVVSAPEEIRSENQNNNTQQSLQSVVRAADYQSIEQLCFAIVNSLCSKLGCEQISIGLVHRHDLRLIAVSGLSEVPKSTPGMQAVRQAMASCLDRNEEAVYQEEGRLVDQCESSSCKVHYFWHRVAAGSCVATVPLRIDGQCVAVLALRRRSHSPFVPDDLKRARILGETFAPALPLVDKASRSVVRHLLEASAATAVNWYGWNGLGRKIFAAAILLLTCWFLFGSTKHEILAPCKIAARQVFTVSSPFDGLIQEVLVEPGDRVSQGQVLVRFDRDELLTERNRILTKISSTRIESNALLQERQIEAAFLLQSEVAVLDTELQLIDQKLNHSTIRAQSKGVVLPTEVHRRIGQFVVLGEPLLEIANEHDWHLEIETPENQVRHLKIGQAGEFQSRARPDLVSVCQIDGIHPSTQIVGQNNVVMADASLSNRLPWMKIGMQGYVRIDAGRHPVWWVYLHPVLDHVRLRLWM